MEGVVPVVEFVSKWALNVAQSHMPSVIHGSVEIVHYYVSAFPANNITATFSYSSESIMPLKK